MDYAELSPADVVLEIGPGSGVLTRRLAAKAREVIAIEKDARFIEALARIPNLRLLIADAMTVGFPECDKLVANLPYHISSAITLKILGHKFKCAVLMYQKEFAERLVARSGKAYSRLSVRVYYRANVELLEHVPKNAFAPQPKVDGAIVKLIPRKTPFSVLDEDYFFELVKLLFIQRRKKIKNILTNNSRALGLTREVLCEHVNDLWCKDMRPEELAPEQLGGLADALWALRAPSLTSS